MKLLKPSDRKILKRSEKKKHPRGTKTRREQTFCQEHCKPENNGSNIFKVIQKLEERKPAS